jgi:hypothetical protein
MHRGAGQQLRELFLGGIDAVRGDVHTGAAEISKGKVATEPSPKRLEEARLLFLGEDDASPELRPLLEDEE